MVDKLALASLVLLATGPVYLGLLLAYGANPTTLNVGYAPTQPVPYSHALHVGKLGMDCRYCHNTVEKAGMAALPPTETCMNCHTAILPNSAKLAPVRESYTSGMPIPWVKVHDIAGYVFFTTCPRQRGGGLRGMPRTGGSNGSGRDRQAAEHGLVSGLPPRSGPVTTSEDQLPTCNGRRPAIGPPWAGTQGQVSREHEYGLRDMPSMTPPDMPSNGPEVDSGTSVCRLSTAHGVCRIHCLAPVLAEPGGIGRYAGLWGELNLAGPGRGRGPARPGTMYPWSAAVPETMAASLGLAGLATTGCIRLPEEKLAPYAHRPENRMPGTPVSYATAMEIGGVAQGLLVTGFDGRPIKIEGNPSHPLNRGAADMLAQASVLELYDPDRSFGVIKKTLQRGRGGDGPDDKPDVVSQTISWDEFRSEFTKQLPADGAGFCVLSEASNSPSLAAMRAKFQKRFPKAEWYEYEAVSDDNVREGTLAAFGLDGNRCSNWRMPRSS